MTKSIFALALVALISMSGMAQKKAKAFVGIITYTMTYDGTWDAATLAQQPKELKLTIMGNKSKLVMDLGQAMISTITNGEDSTQIVLLDVPAYGLKNYIKVTKEKLMAKEGEEPEIKYLDETKEICGYVCKKAEYTVKDEFGDAKTTVVYYSTEINNGSLNLGREFPGLKGFPMEYTAVTDEGKITTTVTLVETKKIKVKDVDFLIPTDYTEMDDDTRKQLFGGEE